ncbi:MAG: cytidylate kinase [Bdellovibrionaceae bacterium]|nr:cytidylate kinase [Pseudobdellovibrionaceae bacterium]|tara:strand:- start:174 stop:845 length:672 start_codon:yes stop_codon:yes gene_type:complete
MRKLEEPVITIDGPSASGKSTVSRGLAKKLDWNWVSTGAFYRGLAYAAEQEGIASNDEAALVQLAASNLWRVEMNPERTLVFYKDKDVSDEIFAEKVGEKASQISQLNQVRQALLDAQRVLPQNCPRGLVAEGRDCGSVVFPQAALKVYLTANPELRAKRRALEQGLDPEKTKQSQVQRDSQDSTRTTAPLTIPEGAEVLDTTDMTLDEVIDTVYQWSLKALN